MQAYPTGPNWESREASGLYDRTVAARDVRGRDAVCPGGDEVGIMAVTPKGIRNNQLNTSAFALGPLVGSGNLQQQVVEEQLTAAPGESGSRRRKLRAH